MKCQACGQEVLLAERCPYCGRPTGVPSRRAGEGGERTSDGKVSGRFVGPIGRRGAWYGAGAGWEPGASRPDVRLPVWEYIRRLVAYIADPRVAGWKKGLLAAAALYVLVPLDLMPSLVLPGIGWLDDLLVLWLGLPALARELAAYMPGRRLGR